jgi:hypothetical protein
MEDLATALGSALGTVTAVGASTALGTLGSTTALATLTRASGPAVVRRSRRRAATDDANAVRRLVVLADRRVAPPSSGNGVTDLSARYPSRWSVATVPQRGQWYRTGTATGASRNPGLSRSLFL